MNRMTLNLKPRLAAGATVEPLSPIGWRLSIPAGPGGRYRLAQLDDYGERARRHFIWQPPVRLRVRARASQSLPVPGTWGVGLWNDPFSLALLNGAEVLRLPALPNAVWFFFASSPNHLSLYDDQPGSGNLAAVFRSWRLPTPVLAPGLPFLPLIGLPPVARWLRRVGRRLVRQAGSDLVLDPADWHEYTLEWHSEGCKFRVDQQCVLETALSPLGPLGLVIWVDNQFAAFPPSGRLRFGTLETSQPVWMEIELLELTHT